MGIDRVNMQIAEAQGQRTLLLRGGLVLVMPVFFGVDGVWWSVAAAELLGVVLSVVLLVLMRRRYHYA